MTSSSPKVATTSPSQQRRRTSDRASRASTAGRSNMRLATIAPDAPADDLRDDVHAASRGRRARRATRSARRDDGVEVRARHRPEGEDQRDEPGAGRDRVLEQLRARRRPGESRCAAIPEPTTTATRKRGAERFGASPGGPRSDRARFSSSGRPTPARCAAQRVAVGPTVRSSPAGISTSASTV